MVCEEVKIEINEDIEKIMCENLSQKQEQYTIELKSCEDCWNYDSPYIHGGTLHCCSYDYEHRPTTTSREMEELFKNCPINKNLKVTKKFIKKYGIIHNKPRGRYSRRGSISVVDFSRTTFEWDGNNPDVDWEEVVTFYYTNQEDADVMMELALDYYNRFNLEAEYVPKHCFG